MSTDGQNFDTPTNPSDDTQPQATVSAVNDVVHTQSRRNFLRTAVISGVAVATVGTTAGVAAAAAQPHTGVLTRLGIANPFGASGPATCDLCFESSGFDSVANNTFTYNHGSGSTNPGTFYFFFRAANLAPGNYTVSISPDFEHTASNPFEYQGSNSVKLYQFDANTAFDCPVELPSGKADETTDTFPISHEITGSNADLWVAAHFSFDGKLTTGNHDYAFTITLSGDATCSQPITLHAVQSDV
jgi:hypothetical protein